jgi:hypothetical protein
MLTDLLPIRLQIDTATLAGISLWALALYLGFFPVGEWVTVQLNRWFNYAERSLYTPSEFERTRAARESLNSLYASVLSIVPFLGAGGLCNYGVELGLGRSWAVSMGMIACIGCGIYELGRRSVQSDTDS